MPPLPDQKRHRFRVVVRTNIEKHMGASTWFTYIKV